MFVTDEKIEVEIEQETKCIAGGHSIPIRFKLPFNPFEKLTVGI